MAKKAKSKSKKITPLMQQYQSVKAQHPDAILLFRVGDFYETFGEDAVTTAKILGIVLTKRNNGGVDIELAGFPHHSLDLYLPRMVRAGYRVAICEQLEKPSKEKKIVKRGVTEVVTPGIATSDQLLNHKTNNFLAAVSIGKKDNHGLALLDISTGEFLVCEGSAGYIDKMLQSFTPSEVIYSKNKGKEFEQYFGSGFYTYPLDDWAFSFDYCKEKIVDHFEIHSLKGFGIEEMESAQIAAGSILHYLSTTENTNLKHISAIKRIQPNRYVWLDRFTIRNLELLFSPHEGGVALIDVMDKTISPMGARLMRKWVVLPLKNTADIDARLNMVEYFISKSEVKEEVEKSIRLIGDLERLISKVPLGKVNAREVMQLKKSLDAIEPIKTLISKKSKNKQLLQLVDQLNPCKVLADQIGKTIIEDPPLNLSKGSIIKSGIHEEMDDYRNTLNNSKELLVEIQKTEADKTGIANLKIGFNNVFGYYLEVTNKYKNQGLIPDNWVRKQTLTNAERYVTDELKKLENKILTAQEKMLALEEMIFQQLISAILDYIKPIQLNSTLIARLDCLLSFATISQKNDYHRPEINDSFVIDIKDGRHPVIEQNLALGESYVPNDVFLDNESQQIIMITGPNMAGKSALLRQTALISLMAQMGSFVPAKKATLGVIDKVFTRVGASDNISSGESTFMVEMNETASIMNNISDRSLILLDEIGRGTSTYDGISIAWSIAEYLHDNAIAQPKTLFATHYHELNELEEKFPRIKNFNIATKEIGQKVIFLRKLVKGGSKHSFGIHVAKMAGMPKSIVDRATTILSHLEKKVIESGDNSTTNDVQKTLSSISSPMQLNIFEAPDPKATELVESLNKMDINALTPIEALMKLNELKDSLK